MGNPVLETENKLTYRELYAAILGAVVGVLAGYAHLVGRTSLAVNATAVFVALALGLGATSRFSPAKVAIRREPWYALAAFLAGGVAVVALLGGGTEMIA